MLYTEVYNGENMEGIALDKTGNRDIFCMDNFSYVYIKRVVTPHWNHLTKRVLMRGQNICFHSTIRKLISELSLVFLLILALGGVYLNVNKSEMFTTIAYVMMRWHIWSEVIKIISRQLS